MMRIHQVLAVAVLAGALAAPRIGTAQKSSREKAKQSAAAAVEHHAAGRYHEAAQAFLEAYDAFPNVVLLFSAAQSYRLAGEHELALSYYEKYLAVAPRGDDKVRAAEEYVAALKEQLGKDKPKEPEKPATPDPPPAPTGKTNTGADATGQSLESTKPGSDSGSGSPLAPPETQGTNGTGVIGPGPGPLTRRDEPAPPTGQGRWLKIGGIASAGIGVAALGLAGWYGKEAGRLSGELEQVDAWTSEDLAKFDQGQSAQTRSRVFVGVGAAAVIAGGVMYFLGRRSGERAPQRDVAVTVDVSGTAAIVGVAGRL